MNFLASFGAIHFWFLASCSDNKHHEQSSNYSRDNGVGDDVTEHATRFFRFLNSRRGRWAYNGDLEQGNVLGCQVSGPDRRVVHLADLRALRNLPRVGRVECAGGNRKRTPEGVDVRCGSGRLGYLAVEKRSDPLSIESLTELIDHVLLGDNE